MKRTLRSLRMDGRLASPREPPRALAPGVDQHGRDAAVDALKEPVAIRRAGDHDTGQGSQFTATEFIDVLRENDIRISMDGKRRATTVFVERPWKPIQYEHACRAGLLADFLW